MLCAHDYAAFLGTAAGSTGLGDCRFQFRRSAPSEQLTGQAEPWRLPNILEASRRSPEMAERSHAERSEPADAHFAVEAIGKHAGAAAP